MAGGGRLGAAMRDGLRLVRLPNVVVAGGGVWLGHACLPGPVDMGAAWAGSLSLALLAASGNVHNDLLDLPVDRINRPERPLPGGRVTPGAAGALAGILLAASLAAGFAVDSAHGLLVCAMGALLWAYNRHLKALPLWGNLAVSLLCALAVYFPEFPRPFAAGGDAPPPVRPIYTALPALFAFVTTLAREIAKDAEDIPGDRAAGWSTFPLRFGLPATRAAVLLLAAGTLLLLPVPMLAGALEYHAAYAVAAALLAVPLLLRVLAAAGRLDPDWGRIQRDLKRTMLAGMVAILAGVLL
jgi:geranylgeranylglycerol-phosphate geranylgeranyltransferase